MRGPKSRKHSQEKSPAVIQMCGSEMPGEAGEGLELWASRWVGERGWADRQMDVRLSEPSHAMALVCPFLRQDFPQGVLSTWCFAAPSPPGSQTFSRNHELRSGGNPAKAGSVCASGNEIPEGCSGSRTGPSVSLSGRGREAMPAIRLASVQS